MTVDWNVIIPALLTSLPALCLLSIVIILLIGLYRPLYALVTRLTRLDAFGVAVEFGEARRNLSNAIKSYSSDRIPISDDELLKIINRANRIRECLQDKRILWVDDTPYANANIHRFLNDFGVTIDNVRTTDEALRTLEWADTAYELIISDMNRDGDGQAGLKLLEGIRDLSASKPTLKDKPVLMFISKLLEGKGTPAGARVITNRVPVLLQHIFDVMEHAHYDNS